MCVLMNEKLSLKVEVRAAFFRDKRQIGDLRAAEYLARITLDKNKLLQYLQSPSHCTQLACGLVDVFER